MPSDKTAYISCGKRISKLYHKLGLKDKAMYTLQLAFETCPGMQDYEAVNILCEIHLENKEFTEVIEVQLCLKMLIYVCLEFYRPCHFLSDSWETIIIILSTYTFIGFLEDSIYSFLGDITTFIFGKHLF